jgi:hypothetical protein
LVVRPARQVFGTRPDHAGVGVDVFHLSKQKSQRRRRRHYHQPRS